MRVRLRPGVEDDYAHPSNPLLGTAHEADAFGYTDRTRDGVQSERSATVIETGDEIVIVDWAAARFDYWEFSLVQVLEHARWRRLARPAVR